MDGWIKKNWEGMLQLMYSNLAKWKWVLSKVSYQGWVLKINNLISCIMHYVALLGCTGPSSEPSTGAAKDTVGVFLVRTPLAKACYLPVMEGSQLRAGEAGELSCCFYTTADRETTIQD